MAKVVTKALSVMSHLGDNLHPLDVCFRRDTGIIFLFLHLPNLYPVNINLHGIFVFTVKINKGVMKIVFCCFLGVISMWLTIWHMDNKRNLSLNRTFLHQNHITSQLTPTREKLRFFVVLSTALPPIKFVASSLAGGLFLALAFNTVTSTNGYLK
jgi:hypothetical protein